MHYTYGNPIKIKNGEWSALISLARGANCISLRNDKYGVKILREPPLTEEPDNPYLYGMPILFPPNRIKGGRFEFEGREYVFPINEPETGCHLHGELHKTPFELIEKSDSKIICRFVATKNNPYLSFPHEFEVTVEYELKNNGLYHTVTVTNLSEYNMPISLGFHTNVNTLFLNSSRAENILVFADIVKEYERNMDTDYLPTGETLQFDSASTAIAHGEYKPCFKKLSRLYRGHGRMTITDTESRLRVAYEVDEKYPFRLIYNGGAEGYISLEPQTCLPNCQNSPFSREEAGFDFLTVGEKKIYRAKITLEHETISKP